MKLIEKPYVSLADVAEVFDKDVKTMRKQLEEKKVKKYDLGYRSSDIIKKFKLEDWIVLIKKDRTESVVKDNNNIIHQKEGDNNGQL